MIVVYKILHGIIDIDVEKLFQMSNITHTRGHSLKIKMPKACRTDIRRDSFSQRTILPWNNLPKHIVECKTVKEFKREYDTHMLNPK